MKKWIRILCVLLAVVCIAACVACKDEDKSGQGGSSADVGDGDVLGVDMGDVYLGMGILQLYNGKFEWSEEGFIGSYQTVGDTININCFDMTKPNRDISMTGQFTKEGLCIERETFEKISDEKGWEGTYTNHHDLILKLVGGKLVMFKNPLSAGTYVIKENALILTGQFYKRGELTLYGEFKNKTIVFDDDRIDTDLKNVPFEKFDWTKSV